MTLNHKKRFLDSPISKQWHDASATDWFQIGLQTAMLEFQRNLPTPGDMGSASANAFRMQGAQTMISTILNLTETSPERKPDINQNLEFRT